MTRSRRRTAIIALAAGVLVLGAALAHGAWWVWSGHRAFERAVEAWREAGRPVRVEALIAARDDPPPARNAAAAYRRAFQSLPVLDGHQERRLSRVWRDGAPVSAAVKQLLRRHRDAVRLVSAGARRSECRWPVAYESVNPQRSHLANVQTAVQLLLVEATLRFRAGDRNAAVGRLETALALCDDLRQDPAFVTHLVRRRLQILILEACERLFADRPLPARRLLKPLAGPGVRASFCRALEAKGAMWLLQCRKRRRARPFLFRHALEAELAADTRAYLAAIRDLCAYFGAPYAQAHEGGPIARPPGWAHALSTIRNDRERINRKLATESARLRLAETALRLAAHKRATGRYPDRLAALEGDIPKDPFTGGSLDYRRTDEGFRLLAGGGGAAGEWRRRR